MIRKYVLDARLAHSNFKNQSLFILFYVYDVCAHVKMFDIHNARTHYKSTHYQDTEKRARVRKRTTERIEYMENRKFLMFKKKTDQFQRMHRISL